MKYEILGYGTNYDIDKNKTYAVSKKEMKGQLVLFLGEKDKDRNILLKQIEQAKRNNDPQAVFDGKVFKTDFMLSADYSAYLEELFVAFNVHNFKGLVDSGIDVDISFKKGSTNEIDYITTDFGRFNQKKVFVENQNC